MPNEDFRRTPVYRRIADDLRARVEGGEWAAGSMLASRRKLAEEYRANLNTIQRAIDLLADEGLLRTEAGRGTFVLQSVLGVQPGARSAALKTIAAILDLTYNPASPTALAIPQAIYGVVRRQNSDYRVLIFDTYGMTPQGIFDQETHALDVLENEGVSGAILRPDTSGVTLPQIRRILEKGTPIVFIDHFPTGIDCDFVATDNAGGACDAVEYLLGLGHTRIACLATEEEITAVDHRIAGYQRALLRAGITPDPRLLWRLPLAAYRSRAAIPDAIEAAVDQFLGGSDPATAVFVINDFLAQYVIEAVKRRGDSVPGTMSVVGFDDLERFSAGQPFLTTVSQPFAEIGEQAAELLLRRLREPVSERRTFQHTLLPAKLIVRNSCAGL